MDNGKVLVKLTKTGNKALRWVQKAVARDHSRPVLNCVHQDGATIGCDGFRIHATQVHGLDDGLWDVGKVPAGSTVVEVDNASDRGTFPDYSQIIPDRTVQPAVAEITLNARYLRDAIAMVSAKDGFVRLVIGRESDPVEVFGVIETGAPGLSDTNGYALVMPIHRDKAIAPLDWRPEKTTT